MYGQAHCALGWIVGTAAPGTDRRLRNWCVLAAIAPDVDTASFLLGRDAYSDWHHTFGHNVWFGALLAGAALWHHRDRTRPRLQHPLRFVRGTGLHAPRPRAMGLPRGVRRMCQGTLKAPRRPACPSQ